MKLTVTFPDPERIAVDYLTDQLEEFEPEVTCGVGVPEGWTADSPSHIRVVSDGQPAHTHPVVSHATIRLVAYAATTTEAKRLCGVALGLLLAHPGGDGVAGTRKYTGPLPAHDPDTGAELASATARLSIRSIPIVPAAS